jgi:hypothetical protein
VCVSLLGQGETYCFLWARFANPKGAADDLGLFIGVILRRVIMFRWRRGLGKNELEACECYAGSQHGRISAGETVSSWPTHSSILVVAANVGDRACMLSS